MSNELEQMRIELAAAQADNARLRGALENMVDAFCGKIHDFSAEHQCRAETTAREALSAPPSEPAQDAIAQDVELDAARYRYACEPGAKVQLCTYEGSPDFGEYIVWYNHDKAEIDAAIDAAMERGV